MSRWRRILLDSHESLSIYTESVLVSVCIKFHHGYEQYRWGDAPLADIVSIEDEDLVTGTNLKPFPCRLFLYKLYPDSRRAQLRCAPITFNPNVFKGWHLQAIEKDGFEKATRCNLCQGRGQPSRLKEDQYSLWTVYFANIYHSICGKCGRWLKKDGSMSTQCPQMLYTSYACSITLAAAGTEKYFAACPECGVLTTYHMINGDQCKDGRRDDDRIIFN